MDLGASSGRVFSADVAPDSWSFSETSRFPNGVVPVGDTLYWDVLHLVAGVLDGLAVAGAHDEVTAVGVDAWAVDYGLLDEDGSLMANPVSYRDARTAGVLHDVDVASPPRDRFARTGIATQAFNTIYQVAAERRLGRIQRARALLLIPDLINYFLCGAIASELTNASTTQLLGIDGRWDEDLAALVGADAGLLGPLVAPGNRLAPVRTSVTSWTGLSSAPTVVNVASHDTASAVVAVPAETDGFAFISSGTWSLVGVELERPVLSEAAFAATFTNERGVDGTFRFLHNVMGLWVLQECQRAWRRGGHDYDVTELVAASAHETPLRSVIDMDDQRLLAPSDMPATIGALCRETQQPVPATPAQFVRCCLDSLAIAYRESIERASALAGVDVERIHIVGGGSQNRLLCQLTADACGVTVVAGPVEAAAIGNVLVQAREMAVLSGDRWSLRHFVRAHESLVTYTPDPVMAARFDAWRR